MDEIFSTLPCAFLRDGSASCVAWTIDSMSTARLLVQLVVVVRRAEGRGVVDQEIDATQSGDGVAYVAAYRIAIGEVGARGMGLVAVLGDLGASLVQCLGIAGADGNIPAAGCEAERDRPADASAAAARRWPSCP